MTPEAQRIAIAEACGWVFAVCSDGEHLIYSPTDKLRARAGSFVDFTDCSHVLPDYLNDLNAMHEAEEHCFPDNGFGTRETALQDRYRRELCELVGEQRKFPWHDYDMLHATASQRAEAFLRTLNLWVEPTTATAP